MRRLAPAFGGKMLRLLAKVVSEIFKINYLFMVKDGKGGNCGKNDFGIIRVAFSIHEKIHVNKWMDKGSYSSVAISNTQCPMSK